VTTKGSEMVSSSSRLALGFSAAMTLTLAVLLLRRQGVSR
jgi:hypothetical protein